MNLAMSNIAWSPSQDEGVAAVLAEAGLSAIEIAPTTVWPRPLEADPREVEEYRRRWERRGFAIVALQALLFGRDDLRLFEDGAEGRLRLLGYLDGIMELGSRLGARALVFGSPKARRRDGLPHVEAVRIAADLFRDVGDAAARRDVCICIEANPPQYGADFIVDAGEAIGLVSQVASPGFRLHLDTACMHLAGDDLETSISGGAQFLRHFHVSEPNLAPVGAPGSAIDHEGAAEALRRAGYLGYVSVEMRSVPPEEQLGAVRRAASFARETYG